MKKPTLIIIAGPNGSGKTSVTGLLLNHEWIEGCERLAISYNVQTAQTPEEAQVKSDRNWEIIMRGGGKAENIEEYMREFEESCQDSSLPFRD